VARKKKKEEYGRHERVVPKFQHKHSPTANLKKDRNRQRPETIPEPRLTIPRGVGGRNPAQGTRDKSTTSKEGGFFKVYWRRK